MEERITITKMHTGAIELEGSSVNFHSSYYYKTLDTKSHGVFIEVEGKWHLAPDGKTLTHTEHSELMSAIARYVFQESITQALVKSGDI